MDFFIGLRRKGGVYPLRFFRFFRFARSFFLFLMRATRTISSVIRVLSMFVG